MRLLGELTTNVRNFIERKGAIGAMMLHSVCIARETSSAPLYGCCVEKDFGIRMDSTSGTVEQGTRENIRSGGTRMNFERKQRANSAMWAAWQ